MEKTDIITQEELNLILLVDNSYSMVDDRIAQLNDAIPVLKKDLIAVAQENDVKLKMRVIAFSDNAVWKVGAVDHGEDIENVVWENLEVENATATSKAIREANKALKKRYLGDHALRPVVVLITDGDCTDPHDEYLAAIEEMKKCLSGKSGKEKVTRVAIGVKGFNRAELVEFASEGLVMDKMQPLVFPVDEPEHLGKVINWVTVTSIYSSITDDGESPPVIDADPDDWVD